MNELEKRKMDFGPNFQRSIIRLMMTDVVFCSKCIEYLYPFNFAGELSWFFETIKNLYNGNTVTRSNLEADISTHEISRQQKYTKELDEVMVAEVDERKIKVAMTGFIRASMYVFGQKEAANIYNARDYEKAYEVTQRKMEEIFKVNFMADDFVRIREGTGRTVADQMQYEIKNAIPTGLDAIDEEIGGMMPGTFTLFIGASNSGKSMLMPNLAKNAALKGKRTFVTIHEDEEGPTKARYISCFANIPYKALMYGYASLTDEQKDKVSQAETILSEFVVMKFLYTNNSTIENVFSQCNKLMKDWPFDLYLCDYGQCLTSSEFKKYDSIRHLNEYCYHMLKQLALEMNIACAGGAQSNREGMAKNKSGANYLRCTDVAESYGIIKKASNVITINRSEDDVYRNRVVFLLDKARNGRCPVAVECESNFANSITHTPTSRKGVQTDVTSEMGDSGPSESSMSTSKVHQEKKDQPKKVQQLHG